MHNLGQPMNTMPGQNNDFGTDQFQVVRVDYFPCIKQPGLYLRPYTIAPTNSAVNMLSEAIVQSGSTNITSGSISQVVNDILVPSAVPFASTYDNNFLAEQRYIFVIEVIATHNSVRKKSYIQGFTNHAGITANGNIDPNMVHEVSSVIETIIQNVPTPFGVQEKEILSTYYDVIKGTTVEGIHVQTPRNIHSNIELLSHQDVTASIADNYIGGGINYIHPTSTISRSSDSVQVSSVTNSMSAQYMTDILTQGVANLKAKEFQLHSGSGMSQDFRTPMVATEPNINSNRVLQALNRMQGFRTPKASFTFGTLTQLDQFGVGTYTTLKNITRGGVDDPYNHTPDYESEWNGQDPVTIVAHSMIEEAIALAMKNGIFELQYKLDNTMGVHMTTDFSGVILRGGIFIQVSDTDKRYLFDQFKTNYFNDVFLPQSRMGAIPIRAEIIVNILGISKIYLEYAGYPGRWYTLPTVFNSNTVRVLTPDANTYNETTRMMGTLINTVATNTAQEMTGIAVPHY